MTTLRTPHLELRAATAEQLRAELAGRDAFVAAMGVDVPASWPPELYGEDAGRAAAWVLERMAEDARAADGFLQYWFVEVEPDARATLVGVGGFKGAPRDGAVELGYELLEPYRRRGYATEATAAMLGFAFAHDDVDRVVAHTLPQLTASIGVLDRCGFRLVGPGTEAELEDVIRFEIARAEWERRQPAAGSFADKLARIDAHWTPKRIARVNDTDVKLARIQGEFVWHRHDAEDEMFVVLQGRLLMQFRDREQWLGAGEYILVPRGVEHRPVAPEEVHLMLIEPAGTLNTGNVVNERTVPEIEAI